MARPGSQGGRLYVVATPLGNLADITLRALQVLGAVDLIAAENMGRTRKLLSRHQLSAKVISYREQNRQRQGRLILEALARGQDVALVSDAGTPGVSDPGRDLVRRAHEAGYRVVPVPGPSAVSAAVSAAGFDQAGYLFVGFLPARPGARRRKLAELAGSPWPMVFFAAPHRLSGELADLLAVLGDREVLIAREMTKLHEEIGRLGLAELAERFRSEEPRGEITLVVAGAGPAVSRASVGAGRAVGAVTDRDIRAALDLKADLPPARRAKEVARELGVGRDRVYRLLASS